VQGSGQVINNVTSVPVRKVTLSLKPAKAGATTYTAESDAEGKFTIENVEPGGYTLTADRQGFVRQDYGARRAQGPGRFSNSRVTEPERPGFQADSARDYRRAGGG